MRNFLGSPITELHHVEDALVLALNELRARRRVLIVGSTDHKAGGLLAETLCLPAFHDLTPMAKVTAAHGRHGIEWDGPAGPGVIHFSGRRRVRGHSADTLVLFDVKPRQLSGDLDGPADALPVLMASERPRLILVNAS